MPYSSMEKVNPALKGIKPPISLAQANAIAAQADKLEKSGSVDSPWAVAISSFRKSHVVKDSKWVRKEGSEYGKKSLLDEVVGRLRATVVGKKQDDEDGAFVGAEKADLNSEGLGPGDYLIVEDPDKATTWHMKIRKTHGGSYDHGLCGAAWAALHEGYRGNKYEGPNKQEAISTLSGIYESNKWPLPGSKDLNVGVKAVKVGGGKYLVLWTSNAFEDREREIFSTKSWEDYVDRVDNHPEIRPGRVWFWHIKGSGFADIVWQDMVGRLLVEVAKVDDTPRGTKAFHALQHPEEYPDLAPEGWGTSHGYLYRGDDKETGVYKFVHKFESTVLPFDKASNIYGGLKEVLDMSVSAEKQAALVELFGDEEAVKIIAEAQKASDDLESSGVAFKEDKKAKAKKVPPVVPEEEEEEEEGEEGEKEAVYELEMDDALLKEIASHVPALDVGKIVASAVKEALSKQQKAFETAVGEAVAKANLGSKEEIVQQALAGTLRLVPSVASKSADNVISKEKIETEQKARRSAKPDDVIAGVVQRMLQGR